MNKLTLNSKKVFLLTKEEMQELTGGIQPEEKGSDNDCNKYCYSNTDCQVYCTKCEPNNNDGGRKICYY